MIGHHNNPDAWNGLGQVKMRLGDYSGAELAFNRAVELNPDCGISRNNRGQAEYALGDNARALADFNRAMELGFKVAGTHYNRGLVETEAGRFDEAITDYDRALELSTNDSPMGPSPADIYNWRGNAHLGKKDYPAAIADYNRALALDYRFWVSTRLSRGLAEQRMFDAFGKKSESPSQ